MIPVEEYDRIMTSHCYGESLENLDCIRDKIYDKSDGELRYFEIMNRGELMYGGKLYKLDTMKPKNTKSISLDCIEFNRTIKNIVDKIKTNVLDKEKVLIYRSNSKRYVRFYDHFVWSTRFIVTLHSFYCKE